MSRCLHQASMALDSAQTLSSEIGDVKHPKRRKGNRLEGPEPLEHCGMADALSVVKRTLSEDGLTTLNLSKRTLMRGNPGGSTNG